MNRVYNIASCINKFNKAVAVKIESNEGISQSIFIATFLATVSFVVVLACFSLICATVWLLIGACCICVVNSMQGSSFNKEDAFIYLVFVFFGLLLLLVIVSAMAHNYAEREDDRLKDKQYKRSKCLDHILNNRIF